jgi:hypothetical protein
MRLQLRIFCGLLLVSLGLNLHAEVEVRGVKGKVEVSKDGDSAWKKVSHGDKIRDGWVIRTGTNGVVDIALTGSRSIVRLAPESALVVDKDSREKNGDAETQLNLKAGRILGVAGEITGASKFEVKTRGEVTGIRRGEQANTEFDITHEGRLRVFQGVAVIVSVISLCDRSAIVGSGESIREKIVGCPDFVLVRIGEVDLKNLEDELKDLKERTVLTPK